MGGGARQAEGLRYLRHTRFAGLGNVLQRPQPALETARLRARHAGRRIGASATAVRATLVIASLVIARRAGVRSAGVTSTNALARRGARCTAIRVARATAAAAASTRGVLAPQRPVDGRHSGMIVKMRGKVDPRGSSGYCWHASGRLVE